MDFKPYTLTQRRIDTVLKVPAWAGELIKVGDTVIRESAETVVHGNARYRLGVSYTRFKGYTQAA